MHVFLLKWIATLAEKHAGDVVPGQENKVRYFPGLALVQGGWQA